MRTNSADRRGGRAARSRYDVVVIAASMGGVHALQKLLSALPPDFPLPIAIVQHRTADKPNLLAHVLGRYSPLKVKLAQPGDVLEAGSVYVAPPDQHLIVRRDHSLALTDGRRIRHLRSSANPLFASAAQIFGDGVIAVVLTGGDRDATDGVQTVKHRGGVVIVQDEASSVLFSMPHSAIRTGCVDAILPLDHIAQELMRLAKIPAGTVDPRQEFGRMGA